jgi:hypothetical protein
VTPDGVASATIGLRARVFMRLNLLMYGHSFRRSGWYPRSRGRPRYVVALPVELRPRECGRQDSNLQLTH